MSAAPETEIRVEHRQIASRYLDNTPMYPGLWKLVWIKTPFMPWILASMERAEQ